MSKSKGGYPEHRTEEQRDHDDNIVAKCYLERMTAAQTVEVLKEETGREVTTVTIYKDRKRIRERWRKSELAAINEAINEELERIDNLESVYWEAWRRSVGMHKITTEKKEPVIKPKDSDGKDSNDLSVLLNDDAEEEVETVFELTEQKVTEEELVGDSKWLEGVRWCISRRIQLLGLDAPKKIAPTSPDGTEPYSPNDIEEKKKKQKDILLSLINGKNGKEN